MKKQGGEKGVGSQQFTGGKAYERHELDGLMKANAKKPPLVVGIRRKMDYDSKNEKDIKKFMVKI